jgi:CRISPR/Cas system-associated protein Cas7 (RAMP superfamily)
MLFGMGMSFVLKTKAKQFSLFRYFAFSLFDTVHYSDELSNRQLLTDFVKVVDFIGLSNITD